MKRQKRAAGAALRFHRAVSPEGESFQGHGLGSSGLQRKPIAAGTREQTEAQAGFAGRFSECEGVVSIGVRNNFGSLPGHFAETLLAILDLRANFFGKAVGQDGVVAGVIAEEHERMACESGEFGGREWPVEIVDGKKSVPAEARAEIRFDLGRGHLLVDSGPAAHFFPKAAAFCGFAVERIPPKSFSLLDMAGRNEEDRGNVEFFEKRKRAGVVEIAVIEGQQNVFAVLRKVL